MTGSAVRVAEVSEARTVARLLDAFNSEYDSPTPGPTVLADRLERLLAEAGGVAVQRGAELLEINVDGEDTDARRFYERHGYANIEPGQDQPMFYYYRELTSPAP